MYFVKIYHIFLLYKYYKLFFAPTKKNPGFVTALGAALVAASRVLFSPTLTRI